MSALFVMSGLTETPLGEIFREVPPFLLAMAAVVLLATFLRDLSLALPRWAGLVQ